MTDETPDNSEWNKTNLWDGFQKLGQITVNGIVRDVRPIDFQVQTERRIEFLTGYIENLLARVEALEAARDA